MRPLSFNSMFLDMTFKNLKKDEVFFHNFRWWRKCDRLSFPLNKQNVNSIVLSPETRVKVSITDR